MKMEIWFERRTVVLAVDSIRRDLLVARTQECQGSSRMELTAGLVAGEE